ncbi:hypothetical protein [Oceanobacillus alkalisoli]|uniref:hypothetical protein n=1 Tax=Oceanobacillus alkalisoli TaxID=2925113 RepID=UPI001EE460E4|nr:hypothetical protein [Oceanobacillus alkalisoli]MCG5104957.1 hypothetical protein [Oceanobacillus alkalisoli]
MLRFFRNWRHQRKLGKVKPGDGHTLKAYRFYHLLSRSLFHIKLNEEDGDLHTYMVNVNYFSEESIADLYYDGKHIATSKLPAAFPVPGGFIEVETTTYGLKRMHFISEEGNEQQLSPHPGSTEGLRMRFDQRFPKISKTIGILAVAILLTSILLGLPQLIALLTEIPIVQEHIGTFESPIILPGWFNTFLVVAGALAAFERALTLRNHWLIDMDTSLWDDFG